MEKMGVNTFDAGIALTKAYDRFKEQLLREKRSFNRELDLSYLGLSGAIFDENNPNGFPYTDPLRISKPSWVRPANPRYDNLRLAYRKVFPLWGIRQKRFKVLKLFIRDRKLSLGENTPRNFCIANEKSPGNFSSFYPANKGALVRLLDSFLAINTTLKAPVNLAGLKLAFDKAYRVYKYTKLLRVIARRARFSRAGSRRQRRGYNQGSTAVKITGTRWRENRPLFREFPYPQVFSNKRNKKYYHPVYDSYLLEAHNEANKPFFDRSVFLCHRAHRAYSKPWAALPEFDKHQFYYRLKTLKSKSYLSSGRFKTYPGFYYYFSLVRVLQRKISAIERLPGFFRANNELAELKNDVSLSNEFDFNLQMK